MDTKEERVRNMETKRAKSMATKEQREHNLKNSLKPINIRDSTV